MTAQNWPTGKLRPFRPTTLSESFVAQLRVILVIRNFLEITSCCNNTAKLTGLAEALGWINFFIPRGERARIFYDSKPVLHFLLLMLHGTLPWPTNATSSCCGRNANFHISVHHVFSNAGNAATNCADTAASVGMRGFVSWRNVASFWPTRLFHVQRLLNVPHCLSCVAEILHTFLVQSQLV